MSLDYKGIPDFIRERELSLTNVSSNRLNAFLSKEASVSREDAIFDSNTRVFIKGEALKQAIANMDPAGFIPVEDGAAVRASIHRILSGGRNDIILFGLFKESCEFIASRNTSIDEEFLLKFNIVDSKLESSTITTKHKSIVSDGNDWITSFLEQLSSFAGMLIAGKMADLSFLISPQLDINSEGGTGAFKSWGAQGSLIALCLLIELGVSQFEFKRLYGNSSSVPKDIKDNFESLYNDPSKREEILNGAGFDYSLFKQNQRFNDYKAIKDYCVEYISKHQDSLNYDHWISFSQVIDSQAVIKQTLALAPAFSNKWRKYYSIGPQSQTTTTTTIDTVIDNENVLGDFVAYKMNTSLSEYLTDVGRTVNSSYDKTYQSLAYEVDPSLICCLVWYLGPLDTTSLKQISSVLKIANLGTYLNAKDMLSYFGESMLVSLMHMMCHYASHILDSIVHSVYKKFMNVPDETIASAGNRCLGLNLILDISGISLKFTVQYIESMINQLRGMINKISHKAEIHSSNIQKRRTYKTLSLLLDHIIANIDAIQPLCPPSGSTLSTVDNNTIADKTFEIVATVIPNAFPVLKMPESDRRKHFANLPPAILPDLGIEIPGTDNNGIANIYITTKKTECGEDLGANKNIILGNQFATFMRGN